MSAVMYLSIAARSFQSRLAYRSQVWAGFFGQSIQILARIAIWTAAYAGTASVEGVSRDDMVTYSILGGTVLAAWYYEALINEIGASVKTGDVAVFLLKPIRYPLYLFFHSFGEFAVRVITIVAPVVIVISLICGLQSPASLFHGLMFAPFWLLAFVILFQLAATCGLLAFWLLTSHSLVWFLNGVLALFSGSLVPLWFFPPAFEAVARLLPFAWVAYYPVAVYLGQLGFSETLMAFALGLGWAVLLALGIATLWSRASRRLVVQGG
jgi:ABC-2 type transport system permease protein